MVRRESEPLSRPSLSCSSCRSSIYCDVVDEARHLCPEDFSLPCPLCRFACGCLARWCSVGVSCLCLWGRRSSAVCFAMMWSSVRCCWYGCVCGVSGLCRVAVSSLCLCCPSSSSLGLMRVLVLVGRRGISSSSLCRACAVVALISSVVCLMRCAVSVQRAASLACGGCVVSVVRVALSALLEMLACLRCISSVMLASLLALGIVRVRSPRLLVVFLALCSFVSAVSWCRRPF